MDGEEWVKSEGASELEPPGAWPVLGFLLEDPNFLILREAVRRDASILTPMLQELGQHNPHLIHLIRDNEEEFLQILSTGEEQEQEQEQEDDARGADVAGGSFAGSAPTSPGGSPYTCEVMTLPELALKYPTDHSALMRKANERRLEPPLPERILVRRAVMTGPRSRKVFTFSMDGSAVYPVRSVDELMERLIEDGHPVAPLQSRRCSSAAAVDELMGLIRELRGSGK